MSVTTLPHSYSTYIDDRVEEGVFRIDRSIYVEKDIFEAEIINIFENGWVYLCHESQIPEPGDYYATSIGREQVFVIRTKKGKVTGFMDACGHRGARLTKQKMGNAILLKCRYHDFCFDTDGACKAVYWQEAGWPEADFDKSRFDLTPIARLESHRGFIFGSLTANVIGLEEYLGGAAAFLDMAVQPAINIEVISGCCDHIINCNWKLMHENSADNYHAPVVHRSFAKVMEERAKHKGTGNAATKALLDPPSTSGAYDLGNGHALIWMKKLMPEMFPVFMVKDDIEKECTPGQVNWVLNRSRNIVIFPNLVINDITPTTVLRSYRPLSVDRTEASIHCMGPVGEPDKLRAMRLRSFEDGFMPSGMITSDDIALLEFTQQSCRALSSRWSDATRGLSTYIEGPDDAAKELGITPELSARDSYDEINLHAIYRHWSRMMRQSYGRH